jgi:serine/threonine protein kinase
MGNLTHVTSVQYELQEILGEGSSAVVYKALRTDSKLGLQQTVAMKILKSQKLVDVWKREFHSLSQMRSKYCVQIFGFECWNRQPALILEHVDGVALSSFHELVNCEVGEILAQIQNGLRDLHDQGMFHGDLSLENVLVDSQGQIHLLDFGLGNTDDLGNYATLQFAAPEVLRGSKPNVKSDLYSLARLEQALLQKVSAHEQRRLYTNLSEDPAQRDWVALSENSQARQMLAERVRSLRSSPTRAIPTRTFRSPLGHPRRSLLHGALAVVIVFLLALTPHVQSHSLTDRSGPTGLASYSILTKRWYHIFVDGEDRGFTPIGTHRVSAGVRTIRWQGTQSSGQRTLTLLPGQNTVLQDSFFEK